MNIFWHEMKSQSKSLLIWSLTMSFLIFAGMMKYSAFVKTGESINEVFSTLPSSMTRILGIDSSLDLTSVSVFYSIFYLYFLLLAVVHATMLGILIIAKEERDKTAEFLLVKPVTRFQIMTSKTIASMTQILLLNVVTFVISLMATAPYSATGPLYQPISMVCAGLFLIQLLFLGVGLLLGGCIHKSKLSTGIGSGVILSTFLLKVFIDLNDDLIFLTWATPFSYFSGESLVIEMTLNSGYALLTLIIFSVTLIGAFLGFRKRDIHC